MICKKCPDYKHCLELQGASWGYKTGGMDLVELHCRASHPEYHQEENKE
jgi:hypothetical protein